jgi:hypothetical protein
LKVFIDKVCCNCHKSSYIRSCPGILGEWDQDLLF